MNASNILRLKFHKTTTLLQKIQNLCPLQILHTVTENCAVEAVLKNLKNP